MGGLVAFPDKGTDILMVFPVISREADLAPAVVGAKKTVMEQVPLGGNNSPLHPSEFLNSSASPPSIVELSDVGEPPVLVTVKVIIWNMGAAVLVAGAMGTAAKLPITGVIVAEAGDWELPLRSTAKLLPGIA